MNRSIKVCSWNVRGLGDSNKCGDVLSKLISSTADLVLLQETKLDNISTVKLRSFLPCRLDNFYYNAANGVSGGTLMAWSASTLYSTNVSLTPNTLSVHLTSTTTNLSQLITNVCAPSSPELRPTFSDELKSLSPPLTLLG